MIKVALTGGLGCGKSTVLEMFGRLSAATASADDMVHRELRDNAGLKARLRRIFGDEIIVRSRMRRRALAAQAFKNPRYLKKLNALIHPLVARRIRFFFRQCRRGASTAVCVVEVPLLFESGFEIFFDATVVVAAASVVRQRRCVRSGRLGQEDVRLRSRYQMPLREKMRRADFVVDNNGTRAQTFRQVRSLMKFFREQGTV